MKMLLLAIALFATVTLHAQTGLTPLQFNDKLTAITDSLYTRGQAWAQQFNAAYKSKDFKSLTPYREGMTRFINTSISRVSAMKDVANSKPLRTAMLGFLRYELRLVTDGFQPMEQLTAASPAEDVQRAYNNLKTFSASENDQLAKVATAQEAYASENGFRIETEEEAKAPKK